MEEPGEGEIDNGVHQHRGIFYVKFRPLRNTDICVSRVRSQKDKTSLYKIAKE